jgi:acetylglutamate kinase
VHGGGPQATALSKKLGIEPRLIGGRRVTDAATLSVMKMVVAGELNVDLCAALRGAGAKPLGLHGAIRAVRRPPRVVSGGGSEPIDFGLVGDVEGFDLDLLDLAHRGGYLPVLACLGADDGGAVYNINADIVANQLAVSLGADPLVLVTSAPGVLRDIGDPSSRIPSLTAAEGRRAISEGTVQGGMIPKLEESFAALQAGVKRIVITDKEVTRAVNCPGEVGTTLLG